MTLARPTRALPTLERVATEAGVSRSTVSRVVNGSPKVRPEVIDAVNAAIDRLNYVPNRAARSLAGRHTYAVALLVPEDVSRFFGDPYFAAVVTGITAELEHSDYILNLLVASEDPRAKTRRYLRGGNVDGALVVSHHAGNSDLLELNQILPVVFGARPTVPGLDDCCYVDVDNLDGAARATSHLIERGCRRVATITGPLDMPAAVDRLAGWRRAMQGAGLRDDLVAGGDFTYAGGAAAMRDLLDWAGEERVDGVFVANDLMARGTLAVLAERGVAVPGDLALVGYDDSPAATSDRPWLTTVSQPSTEMGAQMARTLLDMLGGRPVDPTRVLQTRLVIRDTA